MRRAALPCVVLTLLLAAGRAPAQSPGPMDLDPSAAGQGTTLLVTVDGGLLTSGGQAATGVGFALPQGMQVDTRARAQLCSSAQAKRLRCPKRSRIGFGRVVTHVTGFLSPGGETDVSWSIDAYLGMPLQPSDAASIVLRAKLLGADRVAQLLEPALGSAVPALTTVSGRVVRRRPGRYGLEATFPVWPGELSVPASMTATPTRLELALGAVRRTRQDFVRHVRVRTPGGYRTREVPDHRLVGYDLFQTPPRCGGSWAYELRMVFASGVKRTGGRFTCADA